MGNNETIELSYIIPFRAAAQDRTENLYAVIKYVLKNIPGVEVIVVEQASDPADLDLPAEVRRIFSYNAGLFNRSWGMNVGAKVASHDVFAFSDNDIIVPPEAYLEAFHRCLVSGTVSPYDRTKLTALTQDATKEFLTSLTMNPGAAGRHRGATYAGGIIYMTRTAFETLGGWDERIRGWGGEDDHLTGKITQLVPPLVDLNHYKAQHLSHFTTPSVAGNGYHIAMDELNTLTLDQLKEACKQSLPNIGNPNKYECERRQV